MTETLVDEEGIPLLVQKLVYDYKSSCWAFHWFDGRVFIIPQEDLKLRSKKRHLREAEALETGSELIVSRVY